MGVSDEVPLGVTALRAPVMARWADRAYFAFFACYLAGLVLWLLLGSIPPVVFAIPALTRDLHSAAAGDGWLAGFAHSIVMSRDDLASPGVIAAEYLFSLLNLAIGLLITVRRPYNAVARLLALACIGTAATFNEPSHVVFHLLDHAPVVTAVHFTFHIVSGIAYLWAVVLFPNGDIPLADRARRRWMPWAALATSTAVITWICYRSSFISHPPFFVAFFGILVPTIGIAAQTARMLDGSTAPVTRQQAGLLRAALTPALAAAVLWLGAHSAEAMGSDGAGRFADGVQVAFPAVFAVVPVMLFVSIVRYRLWDIDTAVSRALLYALLAASIVVAYALVIALTTLLLGDGTWASALAFVVVAVVAEPCRRSCRALANRLVFGTRLTPRETMTALAERLSASSATEELEELARLTVGATRARGAEIWLLTQGQLIKAASAGSGSTGRVLPVSEQTLDSCRAALSPSSVHPISHEGRLLAVLAVDLPAKVALPQAELALVENLAGHAGLLVANARLTAELAREVEIVSARAVELTRSRQGVVAASDAARHRLERDIHDGAQQELVAILIQIRALGRASGPLDAGRVASLRAMVDHAREMIVSLARGGRPAVLVGGGLGAALESAAEAARRSGIDVDVRCLLDPRPPPDVDAEHGQACACPPRRGDGRSDGGRSGVSGARRRPRVRRRVDGGRYRTDRAARADGGRRWHRDRRLAPRRRHRHHLSGPRRDRRSGAGAGVMRRPLPANLTRALVTGAALIVCVILVVGVIEAAARILGGRPGMWGWLAGAGLLALVVTIAHPLVERIADRAAFGRGGDPYAVVASFVQRMSDTLAIDDVLPQLAQSAVRATRSTSGAVRLLLPDGQERREVWPPQVEPAGAGEVEVSLEHAGELVGRIEVAGADETLRESDRALLRRLAAPAGVALSNVRLTHELRLRLAETTALGEQLARSRQRLLDSGRAQQERFAAAVERQVLRRLDEAERVLREAETAQAASPAASLARAESETRACLESLRELAAGVFPPTLGERGVAAALDLRLGQLSASAVLRDRTPEGMRYPAATEAAAYFCCAAAAEELGPQTPMTIDLDGDSAGLTFRIRAAVALPDSVEESLRDRVEALGGRLTVTTESTGCEVRGDLTLVDSEPVRP